MRRYLRMQSQTWRRLGRMMSCVESALSPQNDTSCRSDRFPAGPRRFPARPRACPRSAPPRGRDRARRRAVGVQSGIEEQVRLAALAGHDYVAVQEDRVAVMALSHRALELATRFREAIEAEFERWEQAVEAPEQRERSLTLMSESELEVHLAGQQITELLDHQFLH